MILSSLLYYDTQRLNGYFIILISIKVYDVSNSKVSMNAALYYYYKKKSSILVSVVVYVIICHGDFFILKYSDIHIIDNLRFFWLFNMPIFCDNSIFLKGEKMILK